MVLKGSDPDEVLHRFQDPNTSGSVMSPLSEGRAGTFFGMTTQSRNNTGTVFKSVVRDTQGEIAAPVDSREPPSGTKDITWRAMPSPRFRFGTR